MQKKILAAVCSIPVVAIDIYFLISPAKYLSLIKDIDITGLLARPTLGMMLMYLGLILANVVLIMNLYIGMRETK